MLKLLSDGYVRMTLPAFYALPFRQHMCLRDSELLEQLWREGIPAVNAGYYELICDEVQPPASVGCAWHVMAGRDTVKVSQDDVNSNVMLLDEEGHDYGAQGSLALILGWLCSGTRQAALEIAVAQEVDVCRRDRT